MELMSKGKKKFYMMVRLSDANKNWLELERMTKECRSLDEALTKIRQELLKEGKRKEYVFHL